FEPFCDILKSFCDILECFRCLPTYCGDLIVMQLRNGQECSDAFGVANYLFVRFRLASLSSGLLLDNRIQWILHSYVLFFRHKPPFTQRVSVPAISSRLVSMKRGSPFSARTSRQSLIA